MAIFSLSYNAYSYELIVIFKAVKTLGSILAHSNRNGYRLALLGS